MKLKERITSAKAVLAASLLTVSGMSHAVLPDWASGLGTTFTGHVDDAAAMVGPVVAASLGAVIIIKLIKRFANKI